jgi:hypothetical protein
MWGVSALEASTYLYMAWLFDRPSNLVLWAIDIGRAIAWPLLCAYLSMARPLPVGPRDIMYHSALASGKGVVRDIATLSADPDAPLHHKVRIFRAASNMTIADRAKLDTLVAQLTTPAEAPTALPAALHDGPQLPPVPPRPPTGPGSPSAASARTARQTGTRERPAVLRLTSERPARRAAARGSNPQRVRTATVERQVRAAWHPDMTVGQLQRAAGISRSTAGKWRKVLHAETDRAAQAVQDGHAAQ